MNIRTKARETALQVLYKMDIADGGQAEFEADMDRLAPGTEARRYCEEIVNGVVANGAQIDPIIDEFSENWKVERMALVDRNVLRVAVYELKYRTDVPYRVIIDEAVELAKRYGSEDSGPFVNGIIDKIRKGLARSEPAAKTGGR
ncbi:MAG: transcription antitermination factor NusB [Thermodesulfobacteriota bacterium]